MGANERNEAGGGRADDAAIAETLAVGGEESAPAAAGGEETTLAVTGRERTLLSAPTGAAGAGGSMASLAVADGERYRRGAVHAEGGLGRVVRAHDRRLGRTVAVKELRHHTPAAQQRFIREALITARLEHPAIVPVHDAGVGDDGEPFYTMKMLSGRTLGELIRSRPELDERLALVPNVLAVAEALAYAHSRSVIHRDVKPANVIVGEFGETVLVDWGLAKDLSASDDEPAGSGSAAPGDASTSGDATEAGNIMGTPAYMSPEQARGEPADARSDVYSLGALLYEVLVGRPPRSGTTMEEILAAARSGAASRVEERQPGVPGDLSAVVSKAMASQPADRYPDAVGLAEDLRRFLTGQLVTARHYSPVALMRRWIARHRALVALGAAAALALAATATISLRRIVAQRNLARVAQAEAEARGHELVFRQAEGWLARDPTTAVAYLKEYPLAGPRAEALGPMLEDALAAGVARHVLPHPSGVRAVAFTPGGDLITVDTGSEVRRWDLASGTSHPVASAARAVNGAISSGGAAVALVTETGDITLQATAGGAAHQLDAAHAPSAAPRFTGDGRMLLTWGRSGVRRWDVVQGTGSTLDAGEATAAAISADGSVVVLARPSGEIARVVTGGDARPVADLEPAVTHLQLGPGGDRLIAVTGDGSVWLIDLGGAPARLLGRPRGRIVTVAVSHDGARAAVAGDGKSIHLFDLDSGAERVLAAAHDDPILRIAFSPDDRLLLSASDDTTARIWDLRTGESQVLRGHDDDITSLALSPDGGRVATASIDGTVRVWPVAPGGGARVLTGRLSAVMGAWFSGDGRILMVGGRDGVEAFDLASGTSRLLAGDEWSRTHPPGRAGHHVAFGRDDRRVLLWDARTGAERLLPAAHAHPLTALALSPDARALASADESGRVLVWDLARETWRELARGQVTTAATFSGDGAHLYLAGAGWMEMRDVSTTEPLARIDYAAPDGPAAPPLRIDVAPDGKRATANGAGVWLWTVGTNEVRRLTPEGTRSAFSPDGSLVALARSDRVISLWDTSSGRQRDLGRHDDLPYWVAFSPDGRTLASCSFDRTARLWQLTTGRSRVLRGHQVSVNATAFSPDGGTLATVGADATVRLWPLAELPDASPAAVASRIRSATSAVIDDGRAVTAPRPPR